MTFKQLKESVEDRVKLLDTALVHAGQYERASLEGRLEESRVILDLINRVDVEREEKQDYPLLYVSADEIEADGYEIQRPGGRVPPEDRESPVEDDPDRYDPNRC